MTGILVGSNVVIAGASSPRRPRLQRHLRRDRHRLGHLHLHRGLRPGRRNLASATAVADTSECGMVDQGAALIPNDSGKVLLAGGDLVEFLGESSNLSFIFDPDPSLQQDHRHADHSARAVRAGRDRSVGGYRRAVG